MTGKRLDSRRRLPDLLCLTDLPLKGRAAKRHRRPVGHREVEEGHDAIALRNLIDKDQGFRLLSIVRPLAPVHGAVLAQRKPRSRPRSDGGILRRKAARTHDGSSSSHEPPRTARRASPQSALSYGQ